MKMLMVSYNEAIDDEVTEILARCGLKNYTKINGVFGKGSTSGAHLGNDVWPGRNNLLYIACEDKQAKDMLSCIKELKKTLGKEGIKGFCLPLDDLTS